MRSIIICVRRKATHRDAECEPNVCTELLLECTEFAEQHTGAGIAFQSTNSLTAPAIFDLSPRAFCSSPAADGHTPGAIRIARRAHARAAGAFTAAAVNCHRTAAALSSTPTNGRRTANILACTTAECRCISLDFAHAGELFGNTLSSFSIAPQVFAHAHEAFGGTPPAICDGPRAFARPPRA
jgi:hypothetical protein